MIADVAGSLAALVGPSNVHTREGVRPYLHDATEARGIEGWADAVVAPGSADEVAEVMRWCYRHGVAVTPRGGGTGYAGGAVPRGGVVLSLERLRAIRSFEPLLWRAEVEAGLTTWEVRRLARESGLYYPPDPGAGEQSHIGGNVATNAGGPHSFKYGVTGAWVLGLEVVVPPGDVLRLGGLTRKDVAGYDLRSLIVGSEGTLAVVTAVSLRFVPVPEAALPVIGFYGDAKTGGLAVQAAMASGTHRAAIEFLDEGALEIAHAGCPVTAPSEARFAVIAEADGSQIEAEDGQHALVEALRENALDVSAPTARGDVEALWRWRDGLGLLADAALGAKVSEDIAVPVDHLAEAVEATTEIGKRHGLAACSWGHAGDGNLHSTFMYASSDVTAAEAAKRAACELFDAAVRLGGTVTGEHGIGLVKGNVLGDHWPLARQRFHLGVKQLFDPNDLLNPGKKRP
jgi:glycolate oxidase subunit GlcD